VSASLTAMDFSVVDDDSQSTFLAQHHRAPESTREHCEHPSQTQHHHITIQRWDRPSHTEQYIAPMNVPPW
jgi:hypothetical protein